MVAKFDLTLFQSFAIRRADDRQQHAGPDPVRQYVPVDVERGRMRRGRTPFQHVKPPRIVGEMHSDMVGNEIENQTEVVLFQRPAQTFEARITAELRIYFSVLTYVIPSSPP